MTLSSEVLEKIEVKAKRFMQQRHARVVETDPITLSKGLVLSDLGPSTDPWGRPVTLAEVRVLKDNAHHKKDDIVVWQIPTVAELRRHSSGGVLTRDDLLRRWVSSAGPRPLPDAETRRRLIQELKEWEK